MKKILFLIFALIITACAPNYSTGVRVGIVTKLSYKGLIFESYEGSLNQGGVKTEYDDKGHAQVVPNAIDFNVSDPTAIKKLEEAYRTQKPVQIFYKQWFIHPPTIGNEDGWRMDKPLLIENLDRLLCAVRFF